MDFNNVSESVAERTESTNYEDGPSYDPDSAKLALVKNVLNNLLEDSFYESDKQSLNDVSNAFKAVVEDDPEFPLKLAKYTRQEEGLRQVPQLLLVLAAEHRPGDAGASITSNHAASYVEDYAPSVMDRADEPLDVLALWKARNSSSISAPLKRGIEDAVHQFNEYQFAKWDRPSREFQYRDLLNLVHPKPRDAERKAVFESIALGELDSHEDVEPLTQEDTWEDQQSAAGESDDTDSEEVWREQLQEGEDGYSMPIFARVRNARNMLEDDLSGEEVFNYDE